MREARRTGFTNQQIGDVLGVSETAVRNALKRAGGTDAAYSDIKPSSSGRHQRRKRRSLPASSTRRCGAG
ncbi:hypothetical protein GS884_09115 [Rhodococcus hoagii]|nr:hypothetical protein [Prescottella equi]